MTHSETLRGTSLGLLVALVVIVGCLLARVSLALAAEGSRRIAVIWVENEDDRALVERVRGQVSDLELELQVVEASPAGPRRAPAGTQAFALVWFTRGDKTVDRIVVNVTAGSETSGRTLVRELGSGAPAPAEKLGSATLEAAALVVREALRELFLNEPPPPRAPPPAPEPAPPPARDAPPSHEESSASVHFRTELTWDLVLDGVGPFRRSGPGFRIGAAFRQVEVLAFAASTLPVTVEDAYGSSRLRRYAFGLRGGYEWRPARSVSLGAGVLGGVALYARSVQELDPIVTAAGDRVSRSALVGPELRAGWAPGNGPMELVLTVGLHVVPGAPRVGYEVDGRFEPSYVLWRAQPAFGLSAKFLADRLP